MAKKGNGKKREPPSRPEVHHLHPDTKKSIVAVALLGVAILLALAFFGKAGLAGGWLFALFDSLLGWGYFILPVSLLLAAGIFVASERQRFVGIALSGIGLLVLSVLGLIELAFPGHGGWLGLVFGSLRYLFDQGAAIIIDSIILVASLLVALNLPIKIKLPEKKEKTASSPEPTITGIEKKEETKEEQSPAEPEHEPEEKDEEMQISEPAPRAKGKPVVAHAMKDYVPPPLSLLSSSSEKPTTGDLRANANIIKRTLESFGIPVEMNEINIGPTVTRYTLKPAEGVKLSRIVALHSDLALALAAHPIRIEAPIPGKSLVGIEVPNKAAALVRLGNLMGYQEFQSSGPLGFSLGRDVNGEPIFPDIDRMPHLLVAGATGSGKSVTIHALLISLFYKNGPASLKLILIDPKRVELSIYDGLPHLVSPVITENKKAVSVFRWAIKEMERRYDLLLESGSRDVQSYNKKHEKEPIPYLVIVVDELADLMTTYGREVEGSIIRLAQMARATGIHLVLSTQRPSVEVITGLIKANITTRIALQVASQIDSRTILDTGGAEKLLGHGDLLMISSEFSKPKRIQGAYITEEEIAKVTNFIKENNETEAAEDGVNFSNGNGESDPLSFDEYPEDDDDELYDEALDVVRTAGKASASLLQRRLKVGYARAARLLDLMEMKGVIGPGEGAKPREVYLEKAMPIE